EEKEDSIRNLQETTAEQDLIITQRTIITWAVGGLFLLLGGLAYLFYRKRQADNKYRVANVEQRLLRSQLNPHFLFNALNSVVSLASVRSDKTVPYTLKLSSLLRAILQNSRAEFVTLAEELSAVEDYLELESNFSEQFSYDVQLDERIDVEELLVPPMFIQPFLENAIKHGIVGKEDGYIELRITLSEGEKSLQCIILDNGTGYSKSLEQQKSDPQHQSVSGDILNERLQLYAKTLKSKAFFSINDLPNDEGTRVDIHIPYVKDN
ncbi:MAG: histidine kinase, partial [Bacteroidota bacterium]